MTSGRMEQSVHWSSREERLAWEDRLQSSLLLFICTLHTIDWEGRQTRYSAT